LTVAVSFDRAPYAKAALTEHCWKRRRNERAYNAEIVYSFKAWARESW
jgi:hypothetical protein